MPDDDVARAAEALTDEVHQANASLRRIADEASQANHQLRRIADVQSRIADALETIATRNHEDREPDA